MNFKVVDVGFMQESQGFSNADLNFLVGDA